MDESSKIIAINTDPNAPIFEIAHYKIMGDLRKVIPQMIRAYREGGEQGIGESVLSEAEGSGNQENRGSLDGG
jgi:hypothetical protein